MNAARSEGFPLLLAARSRVSRREPPSDQIPVPGIPTDAGAWVLERLELKAIVRQTDRSSVGEQSLSICRHEVRHFAPLPHVTVEPEPTVHRVDHSIATPRKLDIVYRGWRPIHSTPSVFPLLTDHNALSRRRRKWRIAAVDVAADRVSHVVFRLGIPSLPGHDANGKRHPV